MYVISIDPYNQVIAERFLSGETTGPIDWIRSFLGIFSFRPQPGLDGYDLLLINPEKISEYDIAAFRYQHSTFVFGVAVFVGYDPFNDRLMSPKVNLDQLKGDIEFLSVKDSIAISSEIRLAVAKNSTFKAIPFLSNSRLFTDRMPPDDTNPYQDN